LVEAGRRRLLARQYSRTIHLSIPHGSHFAPLLRNETDVFRCNPRRAPARVVVLEDVIAFRSQLSVSELLNFLPVESTRCVGCASYATSKFAMTRQGHPHVRISTPRYAIASIYEITMRCKSCLLIREVAAPKCNTVQPECLKAPRGSVPVRFGAQRRPAFTRCSPARLP
jgi:hypothetical protein